MNAYKTLFHLTANYAVMNQLRWIGAGVLGGALYTWLVSMCLARSLAVAWPDWYAPLFQENLRLGNLIWEFVVVWLPCLLIAVFVGFGFRKTLRENAIPAASVGGGVSLLYVAVFAAAKGDPSAVFDLSSLVVIAILPLGVLLTQLHNKSFNRDASDAGAG